MSSECKGKNSWPELLGAKGDVAAAKIEKQNPYVSAQIVLEGTFVTLEFSCSRVRVWFNTSGIVTRAPAIG